MTLSKRMSLFPKCKTIDFIPLPQAYKTALPLCVVCLIKFYIIFEALMLDTDDALNN